MNLYLTIRNYHEKEVGIAFRWIEDRIEFNHYYDKEESWIESVSTKEEIIERYCNSKFFECIWYTEEGYKAMLTMKELVS